LFEVRVKMWESKVMPRRVCFEWGEAAAFYGAVVVELEIDQGIACEVGP
jgi:hypothetical protein